jgi:hypothetical protein
MAGLRGDTKFQANDDRDAAAGPDLATEAIGLGSTGQERGQTGQRLGR